MNYIWIWWRSSIECIKQVTRFMLCHVQTYIPIDICWKKLKILKIGWNIIKNVGKKRPILKLKTLFFIPCVTKLHPIRHTEVSFSSHTIQLSCTIQQRRNYQSICHIDVQMLPLPPKLLKLHKSVFFSIFNICTKFCIILCIFLNIINHIWYMQYEFGINPKWLPVAILENG